MQSIHLRRFIFSIVLGVLFSIALNGQQFAFQHFGIEDGLPSSYLYDLAQDKEGYLWISSEGGLCRFNGFSFQKPSELDSIGNAIINLEVGSDGRLWMIDLYSNIYYKLNNKVHLFEEAILEKSFQFINIAEDQKNRYWIANSKNLISLTKDTKTNEYRRKTFNQPELKGGKLIVTTKKDQVIAFGKREINIFENNEWVENISVNFNIPEDPESAILYGDSIILTANRGLYAYNLKSKNFSEAFTEYKHYFSEGVIDIFLDRNNQIWVTTMQGVLFLKKQEDGTVKPYHLFKDIVMGSILQDSEGNIWMSTQQDGLYMIPSTKVQTIPLNNQPVNSIAINENGNLICGYSNNKVSLLNEKFQISKTSIIPGPGCRNYDILPYKKEQILFFSSKELGAWNEHYQYSTVNKRLSFKTGFIDGKERIWYGSSTAAGYIENDKEFRIINIRTYASKQVTKSKAYFGTIDGLYIVEDTLITKHPDPVLRKDIRSIAITKDSTLWLSTQNNGILVYRDSLIRQIRKEDGLLSNTCKKLVLSDPYAWVATNNGINRIHLKDFNINSIDNSSGLPSREVNYVISNNNKIYAATNKGIAVINERIQLNEPPPLLHFDHIKINEKDTTQLKAYKLDANQNNIKISFSGIAFRDNKNILFQYQMEGVDKQWITTNNPLAQYPSLPPGKYTFKTRVKRLNSEWSAIKAFTLDIATPFWKTLWFIGLLLAIVAFITYQITRAINKSIRDRDEIQQKIRSSRLTALRAQMNPHFVFNSLNSIQEYIIKEDKRSANRYLARFSRLMRKTLNMSDQDNVSLSEEIEALRLYLDLEALRFEDDFQFNIKLSPSVNPAKIYIPSLLIQPYVENAVKHGLLHKKENRQLLIEFYMKNGDLYCLVEDNGIGRERSLIIKQANPEVNTSKGMSLTHERLRLLNASKQNQLDVVINDLKDDQNNPVGTQVLLCIKPIINNQLDSQS